MTFLPKRLNHSLNQSGFTLTELIVVVLIIGVLAAISATLLRPAVFYGRGRDAHRQSDLELVRGALEQYYLDNSRLYPNGGSIVYADLETALAPYLDTFPNDPLSSGAYTYAVSGDSKCYQLGATQEVQTPTSYQVCGGSLACQTLSGFCP